MCDKRMPMKLKGKVYRTVIRPVLMYGSETWATKKQEVSKVAAAEMKMLRWSAGHTKLDKIRNEVIRAQLKVAPVEEKLRENRLRWYGHTQRRDDNHICKAIQNWKLGGKSRRGRPLKRWIDCVKEDMKIKGVEAEDALERNSWRQATHFADPK